MTHPTQLEAVRQLMASGRWWTLYGLKDALQSQGIFASETGISARVRDLRKCGLVVDRRQIPNRRSWEYRLVAVAQLELFA